MAVDLGNYDVVAALQQHGCPLCRVLAAAETRAMDTFIEEGMQLGETTDAHSSNTAASAANTPGSSTTAPREP